MGPAPGIFTTDLATAGGVSPLDKFRKEASFDWKKMRSNVEDPEQLAIKVKLWRMLEQNKVFERKTITSTDESKRITAAQLVELHNSALFKNAHTLGYKKRTRFLMTVNEAVNIYSPSLSIKFALGVSLFANAISSLGTERHEKFYNDVWEGKILSCLALTELAHGSDTKRMRTMATYDSATQEFVIHTPDYKAAKCWAGNLGKQCTHALLFAQLWVKDVCHGLHAFIVPVRDPLTLQPYTGITVGDVGEKAGLHGIDNGFIIFNMYRIPRENMLNRIGDITPEGEYETSFTNPQRILGAALENLSAGRVAIMQESTNALACAVIIGTRYAALRTQFSDNSGSELPLLNYQLHQWRLFRHLAAAYVFKVFVLDFSSEYLDCVVYSQNGSDDTEKLANIVSGVHAIVCCSKPLVTWAARDAIQEAREACGGNGYLKAAGLADLRNNHDPTVTYEGDNNVLLQQTSNWLLRQCKELRAASAVPQQLYYPLTCISYLVSPHTLRARYSRQPVCTNNFVETAFDWLVCWMLHVTERKVESLTAQMDRTFVKNHSQVFHAHTLSLVFAQNNALKYFWRHCERSEPELRPVLEKLYFMYALTSLQQHLAILYQGGFCEGPELPNNLNTSLLQLCSDLRPEAVSLVEALAPPDFILNSIIARSDGKLYENLIASLTSHPGAMERPSWWREAIPRSKL